MILTAQQILKEGLITKVKESCIQQIGIDLELIKVSKVVGVGVVLKDQPPILPTYEEIATEKNEVLSKLLGKDCEGWLLQPGYYEIMLNQGCKLPRNRTMKLRERSTICRTSANIITGLYDPGFETDNIGAFMLVHKTIFIEKDSRVCQAYITKSNMVEKSYEGQYQNDAQRR